MEKNEKIGLAKELVTSLYQIAKRYESRCLWQQTQLEAQTLELERLQDEMNQLRQENEALRKRFAHLTGEKDTALARKDQTISSYLHYITDSMEKNLHEGIQQGVEQQEELRQDLVNRQEQMMNQLQLLSDGIQQFRRELQSYPPVTTALYTDDGPYPSPPPEACGAPPEEATEED